MGHQGEDDTCLVDSATTHTILKNQKFFSELNFSKRNVSTIAGPVHIIEGSGRAHVILPNGTHIFIKDALYSSSSRRNLLSVKDIRMNGYHIQTISENNQECLCIISSIGSQKLTLEKLSMLPSGLYHTKIMTAESYSAIGQKPQTSQKLKLSPKLSDPEAVKLWHDRLGHPGTSMMRNIIDNTSGHSLINHHLVIPPGYLCVPCSLGKLVIKPSQLKIAIESPSFLQRIQGDICGPINPPSGPFRYFLVLIDASTRWSYVSLLSSRNMAFARILTQVIKLRAQFPDQPIKSIRLDNAAEFTSHIFDDYCSSIGIDVEHPVPHVHTQNGLAESLIKRLQLIARPLLMQSNLPVTAWGHAILHASMLIRLRPTSYNKYSPAQLVTGYQPQVSHLRKFGCAVYVPIPPPQRTKMGPQRRLGIYVGYDSPSIIRYLEPMTGDVFTARFADCHFDETTFPSLGGDKKGVEERRELKWDNPTLSYLDPRTPQCENEVRRIVLLQDMANKLPDGFNDAAKVTKSHVPAMNAPARIGVPEGTNLKSNESVARQKRGRPIGSRDTIPRKRRKSCPDKAPEEATYNAPEEVMSQNPSKSPEMVNDVSLVNELIMESPEEESPEEELVPSNNEISIFHSCSEEVWDRKEIVIDDAFIYMVATEIEKGNDENNGDEPRSIIECRQRSDWPKWENAIKAELESLNKRGVFGPIVQTPKGINPVGYKWVFVRKRNEKNQIVRYKARLVAQGFSQKPGVDYEDTYSPVMDTTTFRYLISLAVSERLDMRLMDVVTAYLYGDLDKDIYMKVPEGLKTNIVPEGFGKQRSAHSIKLRRSLYGLKQSGRLWYNRLSEYLSKEGYVNEELCPCVFIKKTVKGFAIAAIYVDDINLIGTPEELEETAKYLKKEFEMKDLGETRLCLGLQIERNSRGILVHQSNFTTKVLKRFHMDKAHPLSTPMVVRSLDIDKDPYRPKEENEELLGPEVPYMSAIGALMYLAQCTRPDISFSVNLLARYSSAPTKRHWIGVKHIFRYLQGTIDLGLFYPYDSNGFNLEGFADSGFLSDPHKGRSQTGYVFLNNNAAISWKSTKQTLVATSSNHAEILALHEASRECVWLRSMVEHIRRSCQLLPTTDTPTTIFEDNAACIAQMQEGFIKGDRTKHISPKFFYTHKLQKMGEIQIQQVRSAENLADLFTKSLPKCTFQKFVHGIGMRRAQTF